MKLQRFRTLRAILLAHAALFALASAGQGAPLTAYLVKDINPGTGSSNPGILADVNGTAYVPANDGTNGIELWKTNGTEVGTVLFKNIHPTGNSSAGEIRPFGAPGSFLFRANDGTNGIELWMSDGTAAGTTIVKDINPAGNSVPTSLTPYNGEVYFRANDGTNGVELWKSNGTAAGTVLVKDIHPTLSSDFAQPTVVNNTLFFSANDGTAGLELWKSDGTTVGTVLVKDINPGPSQSLVGDLTPIGNTLYFRADDGTHGTELWKSDGTESGTVLVKDINPTGGGVFGGGLARLNSTLFFQATDGVNGAELWKSDGTEAGTVMVKDINPAGDGAIALGIATKASDSLGLLFFQANDGVNGREMWVSDGTEAGTQLLADIAPGGASTTFANSTGLAVENLFFFPAVVPDGARFDHILYVSDGTSAGTMPIFTLQDTSASVNAEISQLSYAGGRLYFRAPLDINPTTGATSNVELWAVNIVPEPTSLVLLVGGVFVAANRRRRFAG
jgi:ELWxxDGT repeat protein